MAQIISLHIRSNLKEDHHVGMLPLDSYGRGIAMSDERNEDEEGEDQALKDGGDSLEKDSKQPEVVMHVTEEQDADGRKEYDFPLLLNATLPPDIRVLGWAPVPLDFSARFSCRYRTYRYLFFADDLNLSLMHKAAQDLVGEHDFRNLCKMDVVSTSHFHRVIKKASIRVMDEKCALVPQSGELPAPGTLQPDRWCEFELVGNAFLYHQVRCLVSILMLVGRGLESPDIIKDLLDLDKYPLKPNYPLASEVPLILYECGYENLQFRHSIENETRVFSDFHRLWRESMLTARLIEHGWSSCVQNYVALSRSLPAPSSQMNSQGTSQSISVVEFADGFQQLSRNYRGIQCVLRTRKPERHVPLRNRPTEKSYDSRVSKLSGQKLQRQQQAVVQSQQFADWAKARAIALVQSTNESE